MVRSIALGCSIILSVAAHFVDCSVVVTKSGKVGFLFPNKTAHKCSVLGPVITSLASFSDPLKDE